METMKEKQRAQHRREFAEAVRQGCFPTLTEWESIGDLKKGDLVVVLNGFGIEVGPFQILGFKSDGKMYLDWDCYWYPIRTDRVVKKIQVSA